MSPARRHRLLCVIASGLAVAAAGCRRDQPQQLNVAVIGEPPLSIGDPIIPPTSAAQATLRLNLAQGLVRLDAAGQVEPGLAERWNVSDDGLSYIFRLVTGEWPDGRKIMARDMARILNRQLRANRDNPTRDALGVVEEVVAMTDRVIEIRLRVPRSNLLQLLAQPEYALISEGSGSGPFMLRTPKNNEVESTDKNAPVRLTRRLRGIDGEAGEREDVRVAAMSAASAIAAFRSDRLDLVLGGTIADLPLATRAKLGRGALRFDPASGLFGLVPARADGPLAEPEVRRLLSRAIDRTALIAALGVPCLGPRATLLQAGLEGLSEPVQPAWLAQPIADRRAGLASEAQRLFGTAERPRLTVALPAGPGGDLIFTRLFADWGAIGIGVERAEEGKRADLRLIDAVAPSNSPAWFLRRFRCGQVAVCIADADVMLQSARDAPVAAQRAGLFGEVATLMDEAALFIPLAAPIRWSLVGDRAPAFQENRFAQHPLAGIMQRATARGYTP
ncbi:MAG: ABC transporter substrate-binding protein [Sphingomonas bacterium]|nr:ABC transporter substrate-binding protein [Sphingomonas bacterium]